MKSTHPPKMIGMMPPRTLRHHCRRSLRQPPNAGTGDRSLCNWHCWTCCHKKVRGLYSVFRTGQFNPGNRGQKINNILQVPLRRTLSWGFVTIELAPPKIAVMYQLPFQTYMIAIPGPKQQPWSDIKKTRNASPRKLFWDMPMTCMHQCGALKWRSTVPQKELFDAK